MSLDTENEMNKPLSEWDFFEEVLHTPQFEEEKIQKEFQVTFVRYIEKLKQTKGKNRSWACREFFEKVKAAPTKAEKIAIANDERTWIRYGNESEEDKINTQKMIDRANKLPTFIGTPRIPRPNRYIQKYPVTWKSVMKTMGDLNSLLS
jgi:hypothetical protein